MVLRLVLIAIDLVSLSSVQVSLNYARLAELHLPLNNGHSNIHVI